MYSINVQFNCTEIIDYLVDFGGLLSTELRSGQLIKGLVLLALFSFIYIDL